MNIPCLSRSFSSPVSCNLCHADFSYFLLCLFYPISFRPPLTSTYLPAILSLSLSLSLHVIACFPLLSGKDHVLSFPFLVFFRWF